VTVKGRAAVDAHVAGGATKHVLEEGKVVWNVMLNQTNIGNNNNKFYVIQVRFNQLFFFLFFFQEF
jgi:poly [ADP-ribose] polymerase